VCYRLQPGDLAGRSITVTVSNVTLQGLEELQPVLHFATIDKRMALDDVQCDAMARLTGQAILEAWIGTRIMLTPVEADEGATIRINQPFSSRAGSDSLPEPRTAPAFSWRQPLLLLLFLALAFGAVYLIEHGSRLWSELQQLLP
jgi:hypothetical protein